MADGVRDPTSTEQQSADTHMESPEKLGKGKGKMAEDTMEDEEDESEEDDEGEGEADGEVEEADEDNMEEIDLDNIVGSRTRGRNIDFAAAAQKVKDDDEELDDDDDEDDDDFEDPDAMEE